jgi:PTS system galactitol-specific IIA component
LLDGFIHPDLIVVGSEARSKEEVIDQLASLFLEKGYVKEGYAEAVVEREKGFPTGLPTQEIQVAIPHTEAEHCLRPGIAVATLKRSVVWIEMATHDTTLNVSIVFLLSITDPKDQVKWLKRLILMFERPGVLQDLKSAPDTQECYGLLREELSRVDGEMQSVAAPAGSEG